MKKSTKWLNKWVQFDNKHGRVYVFKVKEIIRDKKGVWLTPWNAPVGAEMWWQYLSTYCRTLSKKELSLAVY